MEERKLFPDPVEKPRFDGDPISARALARRDDPDTSHDAARALSSKMADRCHFALWALAVNPGLTAAELEMQCGVSDGRVRKRLNDLRLRGYARKGEKRKCRQTGRMAYTWYEVRR